MFRQSEVRASSRVSWWVGLFRRVLYSGWFRVSWSASAVSGVRGAVLASGILKVSGRVSVSS